MAATENLSFRGRKTCICVITIVPLVEAEMKRRGLIKNSVDFYQLGYNRGGVSASAGTHDRGGSMDVGQYTDAHLVVWRMFGVRVQRRTRAEGFDPHGHGWPGGCPHMSSGLRYQESEWLAKRNGLVNRKAVTGPGWTAITWQAAVKKYATTSPKDDLDMATWVKFSTSKPLVLSAKEWTYVKINDAGDVSFSTGAAKIISGSLALHCTGLPPGQDLQLRVVQDDVDGKTTKRASNGGIHQIIGGPTNDDNRVVPVSLNVGKAAKGTRRVRIIALAPIAGVTVQSATISYWKA